jgi:hypothetical protein
MRHGDPFEIVAVVTSEDCLRGAWIEQFGIELFRTQVLVHFKLLSNDE